ncbi:MAG: hypothetical protein ACOCUH_04120 [Bacteriovoracia bacterium]
MRTERVLLYVSIAIVIAAAGYSLGKSKPKPTPTVSPTETLIYYLDNSYDSPTLFEEIDLNNPPEQLRKFFDDWNHYYAAHKGDYLPNRSMEAYTRSISPMIHNDRYNRQSLVTNFLSKLSYASSPYKLSRSAIRCCLEGYGEAAVMIYCLNGYFMTGIEQEKKEMARKQISLLAEHMKEFEQAYAKN